MYIHTFKHIHTYIRCIYMRRYIHVYVCSHVYDLWKRGFQYGHIDEHAGV
jgi:hypothetical protein